MQQQRVALEGPHELDVPRSFHVLMADKTDSEISPPSLQTLSMIADMS
jgi:hypothetical protein